MRKINFPLSTSEVEKIICRKPPFIFLETSSFNAYNQYSYLFTQPSEEILFKKGDEREVFFRKIERYLKKGYWLCGYFNYEFGYLLEDKFKNIEIKKTPLARFLVCPQPYLIKHNHFLPHFREDKINCQIMGITANIDFSQYRKAIFKIKEYLTEGESYEVNFTFKLKFLLKSQPQSLYCYLRRKQLTSYSAFLDFGDEVILSFSPELFFLKDKNFILTSPMKGTVKRGATPEEDITLRRFLQTSKKIKAENLMIVDLLRNDLGRICHKVIPEKIFKVERYSSLYQMTSDIAGYLKKNISYKDIFSSLFPSGSVTGAPKIRTMEIIKDLEKEERGIYTGSIGYFSPEGKAHFNVAIRTIHIKGENAELGIGGGIVYDSSTQKEYEEAILKAKFFLSESPPSLIETIRWEKEKGYYFLKEHLRRLRQSAKFFSLPFPETYLLKELQNRESNFKQTSKVRIILNSEGRFKIEDEPLEKIKEPVLLAISSVRVSPYNIYLYHKTTRREIYQREREKANRRGFFDVIFLNTRGEITETSIANIFILKNGKLFTPPPFCGLLKGVFASHLISQGKARERVLCLQDLKEADAVFIGNSVRGLIRAVVSLPSKKDFTYQCQKL